MACGSTDKIGGFWVLFAREASAYFEKSLQRYKLQLYFGKKNTIISLP
jgi:hypothetical protein